ncbi:Retrovirus-related Pol polyprotein from transposon RE2-like protein [Drosera capensis]
MPLPHYVYSRFSLGFCVSLAVHFRFSPGRWPFSISQSSRLPGYPVLAPPIHSSFSVHLIRSTLPTQKLPKIQLGNKWVVHELDVKNTFLHGHLTEEVYMRQPSDFIHPTFSSHVCRLHKALYGLRQAPRAWIHRFSSFLLWSGFTQAMFDSSMFVYRSHSQVLILLLYVDDIVITRSYLHFCPHSSRFYLQSLL